MNPLTNVKNITKLNETELATGTTSKKSWHDMYKESAWIFIGGLPYDLTEGDVLTVFSQYGEIVNINLVRDKKTGKTKGFCFLCYANQKSTILAVDNLNGIKICSRTIRVDHVANYKPPKEDERDDELTKMLKAEGCAPKPIKAEPTESSPEMRKKKKVKKEKKKKKDKKSDKRVEVKVKVEKQDPGYDKYEHPERYTEAKEYEHKGRKFGNKDSAVGNDGSDKQHEIVSYHSRNENSASISKYPAERKRYSDNSSSSDSETDKRRKKQKTSNQDSRIDSSYSAHSPERNKGTDDKSRHKNSSGSCISDQKSDKSREYKERHDKDKHKNMKHNRHDNSSSSEEDRSSEKHEKMTKAYFREEDEDRSLKRREKRTKAYCQEENGDRFSKREEKRNKTYFHEKNEDRFSKREEKRTKTYFHEEDEDRSSKGREKRTKTYYCHEENSVSGKSSSRCYEEKDRFHKSSRREEHCVQKRR